MYKDYAYYVNKKRVPKLKHPIIISDRGDKYVLFHPRIYNLSFRGLWYEGNFLTSSPYGKIGQSKGRKIAILTRKTVTLMDEYYIGRFNQRLSKIDKDTRDWIIERNNYLKE